MGEWRGLEIWVERTGELGVAGRLDGPLGGGVLGLVLQVAGVRCGAPPPGQAGEAAAAESERESE